MNYVDSYGNISATSIVALTFGSMNVGLASPYVILSGTTITNGVHDQLVTGNVGWITSETDTFTFVSGADISGVTLLGTINSLNTPIGDAHSLHQSANVLVPTFSYAAGAVDLATDVNTPDGVGVFKTGIYKIDGACNIGAAGITLTGLGNFIFVITGALTSTTLSVVTLASGATSNNVFFITGGGVTLAADTTFIGTILSGANSITTGANFILNGRLISEVGITIGGGTNTFTVPGTVAAGGGDLLAANNLSDLVSAPTARTNLGGTTIGKNVFILTNPSAITFPRFNADNTVTPRTAAEILSDIGAQASGSYQPLDSDLTTIAGLTATTNNFIVSVASAWASRTPAEVKTTLSLDAVENTALSTWAGTANITTLGTIVTGIWSGTAISTSKGGTGNAFTKFDGATTSEKTYTLPDANTTIFTKNYTGALATGIVKNTTTTGELTIAVGGDFPTLNQSTTGSAATLTTSRNINGVAFNGSADITVAADAGTLTGTTLNSGVVTSSITSVGTLGVGTWNATTIGVSKGGTGLTALGTGLQVLRTNAGATLMEWATIAGGGDMLAENNLSDVQDVPTSRTNLGVPAAASPVLTGTATIATANFSGLVTLATGTTSLAAANIPAGTLKTTPADGDIEMDANCLYACTDAGNRGYIPVRHLIRCNATRTLPNDTNLNAIFNSPANGRLTLETGTYFFSALILITSMSGTSGNALFNILGAGTATVGAWLWYTAGLDNTTPATVSADLSAYYTTNATAASVVTAGTGTALRLNFQGTFEVTVAGTLIPSIDLVTGAAGVVAIGSYFMCERIGSDALVSIGQWD